MSDSMFSLVQNLDQEAAIPEAGVSSKILVHDDNVRAVLFSFAAGAEFAEHKAPMPVILYFVRGNARITMGDESGTAATGTWLHMQANLPHSIFAETELVMLLLLLKSAKEAPIKDITQNVT